MRKFFSIALAVALVSAALPSFAGDMYSLAQSNIANEAIYTVAGEIETSDEYIDKQWALSNDGTFEMKEKKNDFNVYDNPFEVPSAPGRWSKPQNFEVPGGNPNSYIRMPNGSYITFRQMASYRINTEVASAVAGIDINVSKAWGLYNGGSKDVIIALIDTGVDYTHEDLKDSIWINEDEIPGNGIDDDGNGYIDDVYGWNFYNNNNKVYTSANDDSHGTHGAGTMVASTNNGVGIAGIVNSNHVKVMIIKALGGSDGSGTTKSLINAIKYAEANGASICNLSLSSSTNDSSLYKTMAESNLLFVCAAGNDGEDMKNSPSYPAAYDLDNIISVGNLNYNGNLASSSNYSSESVDLAAPGSYILSTTPENGYSYMTGTSMATPMVSAAAAMIYSHFDGITLADVKDIILNSVTQLSSLSSNVSTGGMLNLGNALAYDVGTLSHRDFENKAASNLSNETSQYSMPQLPLMPQMPGYGQYRRIPALQQFSNSNALIRFILTL